MRARRLLQPAIALAALIVAAAPPALARMWDERYFPNHTVVNQDGERFAFYDDLIRDRIVAINFVYSTCTDICGLATARMRQVVDSLGDMLGRKIWIYSITLTPEIDGPEQLDAYADAFGRRDGWEFLTGDPEEIGQIRWKLGERSRTLAEHRSDMVIGSGSTGYFRRISLMGPLDSVIEQVARLDPEVEARMASQVARLGDQKRRVIADRPGEALFQKGCSGCHTIGGGDRIGPDLYEVTRRRGRDWLMRVLREPNELRREGDPEFTRLDARYPNVLMPYLDLSEADARDVLLYLGTRSNAVRRQREEARAGG